MKRKEFGFTLFELLVSISIIAILTAIAIVSFGSAQKKARDAKRMQDLSLVQKAAEQYYMLSSSSYPVNLSSAWSVGTQTILEAVPLDPRGAGYTFSTIISGTDYCICSIIEGTTGANTVNADCNFATLGTKQYYCVKNQQ
ncbi:MAG: type II secretion system protein [Microgenomates group bacterium]